MRSLHREQFIRAPLDTVFAFFSEARNLDRITPPWLGFNVVAMSDPEINAGTLIHYRLAWHGIPLRWTTLIEEWKPPLRFVDIQLKGPYRLWRHTHTFEARDDGTMIRDDVQFAVGMGVLGDWLAGWKVQRDAEEIFDYRVARIADIFSSGAAADTA